MERMVKNMVGEKQTILFKTTGKEQDQFLSEVRQRVEDYFLLRKLPKTATVILHVKNVFLISSLIFIYLTLLNGWFEQLPRITVWMAFGINQAFLTVNIGHDAVHGSYTNSPLINKILGYLAYDFIGLSSYVWRQTHNKGHHTFTNITGVDPDINKPGILRLSPHDPYQSFHRFQHLYIWVLYALVGINWVLVSDYIHIWKERNNVPKSEWAPFFIFKALNLFVVIISMLLFSPMSPGQIFIGYLAMQCVGGFSVAIIFQLAHLVEDVEFPLPDKEGVIGTSWGEHEMKTTSNFATDSSLVSHIVGGLNFQIEHHLFPKISHCHYPAVSKIVSRTAKEYGLPYYKQPTFFKAVASHTRVLKKLGCNN